MRDNNYKTGKYKSFGDFIETCSSRELEYFVLNSKFTSNFNAKIKNIISSIEDEIKKSEFKIFFNTNGEIAIIDSIILGKFIADTYIIAMKERYKIDIDKTIQNVVKGNEKVQLDFLKVSYDTIYRTLRMIYMEVKYKKELFNNLKEYFKIEDYKKEDLSIVIISFVILEDISKYVNISSGVLNQCINEIIKIK
ncbi:MAG: hypothetical protein AB6733_22890 [Clostridiaceae bacterium]